MDASGDAKAAQPMRTRESVATEEVGIRAYLDVLLSRKWTVAAVTAVTVGAALLFSFRQTPMYRSTAKVLVKAPATPTQFEQPASTTSINMETERQIAGSQDVASRAAEIIPSGENPAALLTKLEVSVLSATQVLEFSFSDRTPRGAHAGASVFAQAYIDFRTEESRTAIENVRRPLEDQIADLTREVADLGSGKSANVESQAERDVLIGQIAVLRSQLSPLNSIFIDPGDVIQAAAVPSSPYSPNIPLNGGLALFVGLGLGIGLAFVRDRMDDRLRGRQDLESQADAPVLATIPRIAGREKRGQPGLISVERPQSVATEAYRSLYMNVLVIAAQRGVRSIAITSPSEGEGKTITASNLAVVLAETGHRVILMSGDLRKPRLHRFFQVENRVGLVNVLAGEVGLPEALLDAAPADTSQGGGRRSKRSQRRRSAVRQDSTRPPADDDVITGNGRPPGSLRLLLSGPIPARPAELLGSVTMGKLLQELRRHADFVIVDTPPIAAVSDSLAIATLTDGVILVAAAASTTARAVSEARRQLDQVGANVLGSVLNALDRKSGRRFAY